LLATYWRWTKRGNSHLRLLKHLGLHLLRGELLSLWERLCDRWWILYTNSTDLLTRIYRPNHLLVLLNIRWPDLLVHLIWVELLLRILTLELLLTDYWPVLLLLSLGHELWLLIHLLEALLLLERYLLLNSISLRCSSLRNKG
jgi:hypothetical protein